MYTLDISNMSVLSISIDHMPLMLPSNILYIDKMNCPLIILLLYPFPVLPKISQTRSCF